MSALKRMLCLSHRLNDGLSCYNGEFNIEISAYKNNEKRISMPLHSGTHIDFPLHGGGVKSSDDYDIVDFIFARPYVIEIETQEDYLSVTDLKNIPSDTDFLIFKVSKTKNRLSPDYALNNVGISLDLAKTLRNSFPCLRAVGINSISINAYQNKEPGRLAHRELLGKNPEILVIEDMKLDEAQPGALKQAIVSPLWVENADGAPVTIIAETM